VRRARLAAVLALGAALVTTAAAAPAPPARRDLEAAHAAQAEAARRYRESLERLLPLREDAVARAEAELARRRDLVARQLIAPAELESAERAVEAARAEAERTRAAVREADTVATEADAARELAALPPTAPGQVRTSPTLIRHDGRPAAWSLAQLPTIEQFFSARFHRPLPISARGQTPVHARLGFDHHEALDVAVHPDSPEGRALMDYLRSRSIPFLAFRTAQPGVATGAHVHIGRPSPPAG
jgi:hypothetical protein